MAIALKYTALERPKAAFNGVRAMARAKDIQELFAAQETWVDPVNNLVAADTAGNIGYMVRGELPIRASKAGRRVPVPGWTGEHEWTGTVPLVQLPRSVNPPEGYIATANQRVIAEDEPYISAYFAPPGRAARLVELLGTGETLSPETIASWQGDTNSRPARTWARFLGGQGPLEGAAERARATLAGWDGDLRGDAAEPLLYAYFRRHVMRELFSPILGADTWVWLTTDRYPGLGRVASGLLAEVTAHLDEGIQPPGGRAWEEVLNAALGAAWDAAAAIGGQDPAAWRWDASHMTGSRHPLSALFPDAGLDPPRLPIGGDGDTLQAAAYGISGKNDFVLSATSVYRQVVDFADPDRASYVIPGGASGDPGSPHFADQAMLWQRHERIPMLRDENALANDVASELRLRA
jgi:penicillin amidase